MSRLSGQEITEMISKLIRVPQVRDVILDHDMSFVENGILRWDLEGEPDNFVVFDTNTGHFHLVHRMFDPINDTNRLHPESLGDKFVIDVAVGQFVAYLERTLKMDKLFDILIIIF